MPRTGSRATEAWEAARSRAGLGPVDGPAAAEPGSCFLFESHFHPPGKEETDVSEIALQFPDGPASRTRVGFQLPPRMWIGRGRCHCAGRRRVHDRGVMTDTAILSGPASSTESTATPALPALSILNTGARGSATLKAAGCPWRTHSSRPSAIITRVGRMKRMNTPDSTTPPIMLTTNGTRNIRSSLRSYSRGDNPSSVVALVRNTARKR